MNDVVEEPVKTITLDQLLPGDILVFKGEDNLLDNLISYLTNDSKVSHGAIFVQKNDFVLADAGENGIHAHRMVYEGDAPREIYVKRLKNADANGVQSVADIAKNYVNQNLPYAFSDLILLGLILLFKKKAKKSWASQLLVDFFCEIAAEIKTKIEDKSGKHAMICSSFVYQCYMDAADKDKSLDLGLKDSDVGFTESNLLSNEMRSSNSLLDLYEKYASMKGEVYKKFFCANRFLLQTKPSRPIHEVLPQLPELFSKEGDEELSLQDPSNSGIVEDLLKAVGDVLYGLAVLVNDENLSFDKMIENAKKQQAMFVTPNDLLKHLTNTDVVGLIKVCREDANYDLDIKEIEVTKA